MSERWTWTCHDSSGEPLPDNPGGGEFPSQADAEAYLGENWQELAHSGVASVTLLRDGTVEYGPMSLEPPA